MAYIGNMHKAWALLCGLFSLQFFFWVTDCKASTVQPGKVALVIGNAHYTEIPLRNPINDAKKIRDKFLEYGFKVIYREDLKASEMGSTLREFRKSLSPGGTALFFYAGHGLQIKGQNFFPSVDARIRSEEDVPFESLGLEQVLGLLYQSGVRTSLVMLDACRNNPFDRRWRSTSRGLASTSAPAGTLISYATRPGSVAADGDGENGLYTETLLASIDRFSPIEQILKRVVSGVRKKSGGQQDPWSEGSLDADFCFGECLDVQATQNKIRDDIQEWEKTRESRDPRDFEAYLRKYPSGLFVNPARELLETYSKVPEGQGRDNDIKTELTDTLKRLEDEKVKRQEAERAAERLKELGLQAESQRQKVESELRFERERTPRNSSEALPANQRQRPSIAPSF